MSSGESGWTRSVYQWTATPLTYSLALASPSSCKHTRNQENKRRKRDRKKNTRQTDITKERKRQPDRQTERKKGSNRQKERQ